MSSKQAPGFGEGGFGVQRVFCLNVCAHRWNSNLGGQFNKYEIWSIEGHFRLEFPKVILPKLMFPKLVCSKLMFPKRNALKPMAPNSCLQTHVSQTHVSHSRGSKLCMARAHQPDYHRVFLSFGTPVDLFPHYFHSIWNRVRYPLFSFGRPWVSLGGCVDSFEQTYLVAKIRRIKQKKASPAGKSHFRWKCSGSLDPKHVSV